MILWALGGFGLRSSRVFGVLHDFGHFNPLSV